MFSKSVIAKTAALANRLNVEPAALLAVGEVESAGIVSWNVKGVSKPPMRFEGHYFYRLLKGNKAKLAAAMKAGLAHPKAGAVKNPASYEARYAMLERAKKIDTAAALASCSWGLGQVMGDHWRKLGYASVAALVAEASSGVDGQIELMARYIQNFGLIDELQSKGWRSFADQYNGPASRKNRYAEKIAAAYARYTKALDGIGSMPLVVQTYNALGAAANDATQIQKDLTKLGFYKGPINGKYGPMTRAAVRAFQKENGLTPDGKYGKITDECVDEAIMKKRADRDDQAIIAGGGTGAGGGAMEALREQTSAFQDIAYYTQSDWVQYILLALVTAGLLVFVYGIIKKLMRWRAG